VFIGDLEHLERAIKYVEENPTREATAAMVVRDAVSENLS